MCLNAKCLGISQGCTLNPSAYHPVLMHDVVANLDLEPKAFVSGTSESATKKQVDKKGNRYKWD